MYMIYIWYILYIAFLLKLPLTGELPDTLLISLRPVVAR
jgi:hypothetical protein